MWEQPLTLERRRDVAAAALHTLACSSPGYYQMNFSVWNWDDVSVTPPDRHEEKGLRPGVGVIEMLLLDEQKPTELRWRMLLWPTSPLRPACRWACG